LPHRCCAQIVDARAPDPHFDPREPVLARARPADRSHTIPTPIARWLHGAAGRCARSRGHATSEPGIFPVGQLSVDEEGPLWRG